MISKPTFNQSFLKPQFLFAGGGLLLLVLLGYWCFNSGSKPQRAIPDQTAICLQIHGWAHTKKNLEEGRLPHAERWWNSCLLDACWADLNQATALFRTDAGALKQLAGNRVWAALSLLPNDRMHPLFVLPLVTDIDLEKILDPSGNPEVEWLGKSRFHSYEVYTVRLTDQSHFSFCSDGTILLYSRFSYLIEDGLSQLDKGDSWWDSKKQNKLQDQEALLQQAIRPERLMQRLASGMRPEYRAVLGGVGQALSWLNIQWSDSTFVAKGITALPVSPEASVASEEIFTVIPDNIGLASWLSISDKSLLEWGSFLSGNDAFNDYVLPNLGTELVLCFQHATGSNLQDGIAWVFGLSNPQEMRTGLREMGRQSGLLESYSYQTYTIFQFRNAEFLGPFSGMQGSDPRVSCAVVNGHLVVASENAILETWIDKCIVNQTLSNSPNFLLAKQRLPKSNQFMVFLQTGQLSQFAQVLTGKAAPDWIMEWGQPGMMGVSGALGDRSIVDLDIQFAHTENPEASQALVLWKAPLESEAQTAPFIIPEPGGNARVLIQDKSNILYCFDANGNLEWRRAFDAAIRSEIHGIDFLKNGTPHLLFNTDRAIYLLAPNGEDAPGYPLRLASEASNPIQVFDFDKNRNYSYFIACQNGSIYGYDQYGRPLSGWSPKTNTGLVEFPVAHKQLPEKDLVLFRNKEGSLFACSRNGTAIFEVNLPDAQGPIQIDARRKAFRAAIQGADGRVFVVNEEGKYFTLNPPVSGAQFLLHNLKPTDQSEYLWLKNKRLSAFGYVGKKFERLFQANLQKNSTQLIDLPDNCVGLADPNSGWIQAINSSGKSVSGFPLAGTTRFNWFSSPQAPGKRIVFVGNKNSLYAYSITL